MLSAAVVIGALRVKIQLEWLKLKFLVTLNRESVTAMESLVLNCMLNEKNISRCTFVEKMKGLRTLGAYEGKYITCIWALS